MQRSVIIANGASLSSAADFGTMGRLLALIMPATWDAATITFQVSDDGVNFQNLRDDAGNETTWTVIAAANYGARMDMARVFSRWQWVKVRSGTSGAPVNQTAQRTITLLADIPNR